jgi:hypothetical protein
MEKLKMSHSLEYWIEEDNKEKVNENIHKYYNNQFMNYNIEFIKSQNYNCLLYNWSFNRNCNDIKVQGTLQNGNLWQTSSVIKVDIIPYSDNGILNNYLKILTSSNHNYILPISASMPNGNFLIFSSNFEHENLTESDIKVMAMNLEKWVVKKTKGNFIITGSDNETKVFSSPIKYCVFEKNVVLLVTVNNYLYILDYNKMKKQKTYFKF